MLRYDVRTPGLDQPGVHEIRTASRRAVLARSRHVRHDSRPGPGPWARSLSLSLGSSSL